MTTTRHVKTPRQRAEETVNGLIGRIARLRKKLDHHAEIVDTLNTEISGLKTRLEYARQDPALPDLADASKEDPDTQEAPAR